MTAVNVKGITPDLAKFIIKTQWELKIQRGVSQYSQSQAILHIVKEYKKLTEK